MSDDSNRQAGDHWKKLREGADNRLGNIRELVERFNQTPTAQHIRLRIIEHGYEPECDV